jgi:threonine/homoserine/homoserine lactone efflux protein
VSHAAGVDVWVFLVAVLLIALSPGPGVALILRRSALSGARTGLLVVLGLEAGLYLWALAAAVGFAALVAASSVAYLVLKVAGAGFLVYLGVRALLSSSSAPVAPRAERSAFLEGLVVQLANPKIAVFMLAFYPQFVPSSRPLFATTALLALLQVVVELVLYGALVLAVSRASGWFRRSGVRRWIEGVSGAVLIGLGVRVGLSAR